MDRIALASTRKYGAQAFLASGSTFSPPLLEIHSERQHQGPVSRHQQTGERFAGKKSKELKSSNSLNERAKMSKARLEMVGSEQAKPAATTSHHQ
jgi:hypothetical protein